MRCPFVTDLHFDSDGKGESEAKHLHGAPLECNLVGPVSKVKRVAVTIAEEIG